ARDVFEFEQFSVRHFSGGVRADGFEHVLDSDVLSAINAGRDCAAVEHEAGKVHASERHGGCRNRLIAAHHAHDGVEELAATDKFDRIGNQFTAHQRGFHTFRSHGLAVTDGDGVELHGSAASRSNSVLHLGRQASQVKVAGHGFDPGVGDAD